MRKSFTAAVLGVGLIASPALAQDDAAETAPDFAAAQDALSDPVRQEQMAQTIAVLGEVLLDLPLAPLAKAAAEMSGQDADAVDPNMTLRSIAPEAADAPAQLADKLPHAMDTLAKLAGGLEAMMPALRNLADSIDTALPRD